MGRWLVVFAALCIAAGAAPAAATDDGVGFDWGFNERVRQEFWHNVLDFNSAAGVDDNFLRFKSTLWAKLTLGRQASIHASLTNESRYYLSANAKSGEFFTCDELVFDNLSLDLTGLLDQHLDLRLGRQNIMLGENFLLVDGTPGDGSRTYYFNALRSTWTISPKAMVDLIYITQPRTDIYLPVWNDLDRTLTFPAVDEHAWVLYGRMKPLDCLALEPYVISTDEGAVDAEGSLGLTTVGAHAVWDRAPFAVRGEMAYQFGGYENGRGRTGLGGYAFVDRTFARAPATPKATVGVVYLSGNQSPYHGWDPLFSRHPWFSEVFSLSEQYYWSNLVAWQLGATFKLAPAVSLALLESRMLADQCYDASFSREYAKGPLLNQTAGRGKDRGFLSTAKLSWKATKWLDTYLLLEYFLPGDFYDPSARDHALFLRWEAMFKF